MRSWRPCTPLWASRRARLLGLSCINAASSCAAPSCWSRRPPPLPRHVRPRARITTQGGAGTPTAAAAPLRGTCGSFTGGYVRAATVERATPADTTRSGATGA